MLQLSPTCFNWNKSVSTSIIRFRRRVSGGGCCSWTNCGSCCCWMSSGGGCCSWTNCGSCCCCWMSSGGSGSGSSCCSCCWGWIQNCKCMVSPPNSLDSDSWLRFVGADNNCDGEVSFILIQWCVVPGFSVLGEGHLYGSICRPDGIIIHFIIGT